MSLLQNSNAIESGTAYSVNNSVRLRQSANSDLRRTFTNSNTSFTFSAWIKRGKLSTTSTIFGTDSSNYIAFTTSDTIGIYTGNGTLRGSSTAVFRDPSAWYHIVINRNGAQAGTTSVFTVYVNNQSVATYTGNGGNFTSAISHGIGSYTTTSNTFDGYMAEINYIDGQALTPSSFGETDTTTGVWKPKAYTGTYGTNGFYLPFKATAGQVTLKSSQITKQTSSSTTIAVTVPSVSDGDLMVMVVNSAGASGTTWTTPSGWTAGVNNASARAVFYRRASSEPASYTVTQSTTNTADGTILVFTNADYDTDGANGAQSTTITPGAITVASNNSTIAYVVYDSAARTVTSPPTGYTNVISDGDATAPNQYIYTLANVAAGSYTGPSTTVSANMRCFVIAIKPKLVIGADYSGNNNTWNTTTISTTNDTTYDAMIDSPTNASASGTQPVGNYAVLNPIDSSGKTIAGANLNFSGSANGIVKSSIGMSSGKWYCEVTNNAANDTMLGICTQSTAPTIAYLGTNTTSWSYRSGGTKFTNATSSAYGASYTTNDIIGIAFDADAGSLTFYKNGVSQGVAFSSLAANTYVFGAGNNAATNDCSFNFGQRPFAYTPPSGYQALCSTNLPDSTIVKSNLYMDATSYSPTGTTFTVTNSGTFQPDFVWIKSRTSSSFDHKLTDSVRGTTKALSSNSTGAEGTDATGLTAFNSNGFTVGNNTSYNNGAGTYISWQWKASGSTVTNTNGSITSTVSANTTTGFSIVTYTGTGANATVGHGLGVAPKMIIIKNRSIAGSWDVYHASIGATKYLYLNSTIAATTSSTQFNNTNPTSTVFSLGTDNNGNGSGNSHVAYCFAEIAGFSKINSYTGNGSADGTFVYTGFRPKFVLIKDSTGATNDWAVYDSVRDSYNLSQTYLAPSSINAESTTKGTLDILSNGFKIRNTNGSLNTSSSVYIYIAFAENPFKNSIAR